MIVLLVRVFGVRHRRHVAILLAAAVACLLAGAVLFAATQHYPLTTGLNWAATTVGYVDVLPRNAVGKVIASAVMLTTIPLLASVFALVTGAAAAAGVRRILAMGHRFPDGAYRIVIGMNQAVPAILDELARAGDPVVLVADGDPTQLAVIRSARPAGAQQALITGASDGDVLVIAVLLRKLAPDLPVVALVRSPSVREALHELGVQQTISADGLIAHTLAKTLEAPHAGDMLSQLVESELHSLAEIEADAGTVGKLLSAVRDERSELVLGLVHGDTFLLGIGEELVVATGDHLLIARPQRNARPQRK